MERPAHVLLFAAESSVPASASLTARLEREGVWHQPWQAEEGASQSAALRRPRPPVQRACVSLQAAPRHRLLGSVKLLALCSLKRVLGNCLNGNYMLGAVDIHCYFSGSKDQGTGRRGKGRALR